MAVFLKGFAGTSPLHISFHPLVKFELNTHSKLFFGSNKPQIRNIRTIKQRVCQVKLCLHISIHLTAVAMGSSSSRSFSPNKVASVGKRSSGVDMACGSSSTEYVEAVVCNENDLKDNEMKVFDVGEDGKVLVVKQNGQFNAMGTKCTHYGAPLITGALGEGRVRCPWHGACFNLKTGDIEDFPGMDSLPCYQVTIGEEGQVKVRAKKLDLQENKRVKNLEKRNNSNGSTFVIVGGGPSGATCAETLRSEGFKGRLLLVARENCLPYDRIKVSKIGMATDIAKLQYRSEDYYKKYNIEILKGVEATKVEPENSSVSLSNGEKIHYNYLYLASGSKPRVPDIPNVDLRNVFTVRDQTDSTAILNALGTEKDKKVVVLGLSFIGLEIAASSVSKAKSMTVVGKDNAPLEHVFGIDIGQRLAKLFTDNGVAFVYNNTVIKCNGENKVLKSVELSSGQVLEADIFVMGVGATFNTGFLKGSGIDMESNGSVSVNDKLQTNIPNIYAGGDIAHAPVFAHNNKKASIGHIGLAQYHGKIAAMNMLKKDAPLRSVPFFWCMVFQKSIRYAGYGRHASIHIDGDLEELKFVVFFFDASDRVIALASCGRDPVTAQFAEFLYQGKTLTKAEVLQDPFAWTTEIH